MPAVGRAKRLHNIGKTALQRIAREGVSRLLVGLEIDGEPFAGPNNDFWPVSVAGERIGHVTSAIHSPRLQANIALAMVRVEHSLPDTRVEVDTVYGSRGARVVPKPFYDPRKNLPKGRRD